MVTNEGEPVVVLTRKTFEERIASERKDAIDALEVYFCLDDGSHCPTGATEETLSWLKTHDPHNFIRFMASDVVENPKLKDNLKADADLDAGLYDVVVMVDGERVFEKSKYPIAQTVRVRVYNSEKFPIV